MAINNSERPFLIYVNNPVLENPQNLQTIFSNIHNHYPDLIPESLWKCFLAAINRATEFALEKTPDDALQFLNKARNRSKSNIEYWIMNDSLFYSSYPCNCAEVNDCRFGKNRSNTLSYLASLGKESTRCFQCDQITIIQLLDNIVSGKYSPTEILKVKPYAETSKNTRNALSALVSEDIFPSVWRFQKVSIIEYTKNDGNLTEGWESICTLQDMVLGLFIEDFFDFLIFDNHRQLKKCHDCSVFYIATKNNSRQKYCPDCSKKNHTPKEVQAERTRRTRAEANKRKKKKKKIEEEKREALYENEYKRLIEAGYSKEGARQKAKGYVIEQMPVIE